MKVRQAARSVRDRVRDATFDFLTIEPMTPLRQRLMKAIGKEPLQLGVFEDRADKSYVLSERSPSTTVTPTSVGSVPQLREQVFGPISAHLFKRALTSPYASGVIHENYLLLPPHLNLQRSRIRTNGRPLFYLEAGHSLSRLPANVTIDEGILIGGAGSFNWYHFIVECLPKVMLTWRLPQEFASWPLLVPIECKDIPSFSDALKLFAGHRRILFLSSSQVADVERLIVIDDVSIGPFNLARGVWPAARDYYQHDYIMKEYFRQLRLRLIGDLEVREATRRFYLVRPKLRRQYNQEELMRVVEGFGFVPLALEKMSLAEQAMNLAEAEALVGPSGAAWSGLAFPAAGLKGISWLPKEYEQFSSYSNIGHLLGHQLQFLTAETPRPLRSSADAYEQSYIVRPEQLEGALSQK